MIMLVIPYVGFLLGYGAMAAMKYTVKYVRGYWEVKDIKDRLIAITMRWKLLGNKIPYDARKLPVIQTKPKTIY